MFIISGDGIGRSTKHIFQIGLVRCAQSYIKTPHIKCIPTWRKHGVSQHAKTRSGSRFGAGSPWTTASQTVASKETSGVLERKWLANKEHIQLTVRPELELWQIVVSAGETKRSCVVENGSGTRRRHLPPGEKFRCATESATCAATVPLRFRQEYFYLQDCRCPPWDRDSSLWLGICSRGTIVDSSCSGFSNVHRLWGCSRPLPKRTTSASGASISRIDFQETKRRGCFLKLMEQNAPVLFYSETLWLSTCSEPAHRRLQDWCVAETKLDNRQIRCDHCSFKTPFQFDGHVNSTQPERPNLQHLSLFGRG